MMLTARLEPPLQKLPPRAESRYRNYIIDNNVIKFSMMRQICNIERDCEDGSDEVFCEVGNKPPVEYNKRIAPSVNSNGTLKVRLDFKLNRIAHIGNFSRRILIVRTSKGIKAFKNSENLKL